MNVQGNNVQTLEAVRDFFNFSVEKYRLSGPDGMRTDFFGLFRSDNCNVVGDRSVSSVYVPHTTDDVVALVEAASEAFEDEMEARCHFRDGHYVELAPTVDFRKRIFQSGDGEADNIFPRVFIHAGYDGKAFKASMGWYRDMCRNMHIMRQVRGTTVSIRHTSGLRAQMDELIRTFGMVRDSWQGVTEAAEQMAATRVSIVDFLNAIYPQPKPDAEKREITIHENRTKAIWNRMNEEAARMKKPLGLEASAWDVFNAVQGYVQHTATRRKSAGDFERMILAHADPVVHAAEALAMSLSA